MTTSDGPRFGPHRPSPDDGGRLHDWVAYRTNDLIRCPGIRTDRRQAFRGDRRSTARPCPHSFGRVVTGQVRVRVQGHTATEAGIVVSCPECQARVEFLTMASEAA